MGIVLRFQRHARPSTSSGGYKSGRSSCRGTLDTRSTASTRSGGTSSHCETACAVMPSADAKAVNPPPASMARLSALLRSVITEISSTTLLQSQAWLACGTKAILYDAVMSMGTRIRAARKREKKGQREVAEHLGVTVQAVSGWERGIDQPSREHLFELALFLKSPVMWLNGNGHDTGDIHAKLEALTPDDRASVAALIDVLLARRGRAA